MSSGQGRLLQHDWDRLVEQGRFVYVVAAGQGALQADDCERLIEVAGVRAAGSVFTTSRANSSLNSAFSFDRSEVSPGLLRVLYPGRTPPLDGVLVGPTVADRLGVNPGQHIPVAAQPGRGAEVVRVSSQLPSASRDPSFDRSIVEVRLARGPVRRCLADVEPAAAIHIGPTLGTQFPPGNQAVSVRLRSDLGSANAPERRYATRDRTFVWALALGSLFATVGAWFERRHDYALYRLLGARATDLAVLLFVDFVLVTLAGSGLGAATMEFLRLGSLHSPAVNAVVTADYLWFLAGCWLIPPLGLLIFRRLDVVKTLKAT